MTKNLGDLTPQQRKLVRARLAQRAAAPVRAATPAQPGDGTSFPLSPAQERLWLADRLSPGRSAPVTLAIRLTGPLDRARLEAAIAAVVARQSALRTVFRETPGGPRQVVLDEFRPPVVTAEPAELAERIRPDFDLTAEPPVAVTLFETTPADHLLLICVHHIVIDGWSTQVFLDELIAHYGGDAELPELRLSFAEYAVAEREAAGRLAEQVAYWRDRLAGAPALSTVPPDRPRPPLQSRQGAHAEFTVAAGVTDRLTALARRAGVTLNTVVTAAFAVLLQHATGQDDVLFGTPVARRRRTELEPLIGSIADTVVTRVDLSGGPSGEELLRRVQRSAAAAVAHQDVPFSELVRELAPARRSAYNPLFQIMLSVSEITVEAKEAAGVTFAPERVETGTTEFDLFLTVRRGTAGLTGVLGYRTDLYLAETARYVTDGLVAVLTGLAAAPGHPIAGLLPVRRRVEVAASFTAEPMGDAMRFWAGFRRVPADARFAPYGQVLQQLLAGDGGDGQVVLLRWSDWTRRKAASADFLDGVVDELLAGVTAFRARTAVPLLLVVCPPEPGTDFPAADERLARGLAGVPGVEVTWPAEYAAVLGVTEIADPAADALGQVPYTEEFFAALGTLAVDRLHAAWGTPPPGPERAAYAATHLATAARIAAAARPVAGPAADPDEYVAPRTETEKRLAVLWAEQLGTGETGVRTSFFAMGGHSLLVTRMLSLVHREFGVSVPFHEFYADPVIAALATTIDGADEPAPEAAVILPASRDEPIEPAATQKRLWALDRLGVHSGAVTFAATLTGPLDEAALRAAVGDVVRRHESLRTTIGTERGRPVLIVHKGLDCWWPATGSVETAVREFATHPYDLETGPLLRVRLLRDGPGRHHLLIGLHQAVCDNESWHVLLTDLAAAYRVRLSLGEPRPPLPVQMADYAAWERLHLAGPAAGADAAYWAECLRDAPPRLVLARARPRSTGEAGVRHRPLGDGLGPRVAELARVAGVSAFVVLLTAYALVLGEEAGTGDVVLGVPSAGRDRPELQGVVGRFAHLMPLRLNLAGAATSRALLHRVHEAVLTAQRHRGVPFSRIVEVLRPPRERAHHPVFQHALNVVGERSAGLDLPEVSVRTLDTPPAATQYELFLHLHWENGELGATAEYDTGRLGDDVVADLVTRFESVVRRMAERPDDAVPGPPPAEPVRAGTRAAAPDLTIATTGPAGPVRREAEQLLTRFAVQPRLVVTSRVFGALLDPGAAAGLTVVVLRWEDLIGTPVPVRPGTLVRRLDEAVTDVVAAARAHRTRTSRPLVLLTRASEGLAPRLAARLDARLYVELAALPATEVCTGPVPAAELAVERLGQAFPLPEGPVAEAPRDDRERALARIWAALLDLDPARIGVHSDFFAIGGDSLLAIQAAHQAGEAGIAVTPRQFSAHPTIAELAALPREKDVTRP
ncbi:condensation domain-containing protein [Amycolatopsis solani]|uniref:condensation domain-containing protein n=1 Tax=Amycolatopsis solani TaxID=3028615 RepID=UPI0025B10039|nr:condensation domain-containing protein [Amycolatopsis sp. MEP2-6]